MAVPAVLMTAGIIALPPNARSCATDSSLGIDSERRCPSWPSDPAGRRSCCDAALSSEQPQGCRHLACTHPRIRWGGTSRAAQQSRDQQDSWQRPTPVFRQPRIALLPGGCNELQKRTTLVAEVTLSAFHGSPLALSALTCRPGTTRGSGRSTRSRRGRRCRRAGRAWTRRGCPPAHSAHQKTARDRCTCNLQR